MTQRDSYYKYRYGWTEDRYETELIVLGGLCAICRGLNPQRPDGNRERLSLDHSHVSGGNRSLLCRRCNLVLGMVQDNHELLIRMLEYLRKYDGSPIPFTPPNLEEPFDLVPGSEPESVHKVNNQEPHGSSSENLTGAESPKPV